MRSEADVLYEIMRQASYLARGSPERRAIEDAASAALRVLAPEPESEET